MATNGDKKASLADKLLLWALIATLFLGGVFTLLVGFLVDTVL